MTSGIFILGNDTDVGKTHQAVELAKALVDKGLRIGAYKPVASGTTLTDSSSDPSQLAKACQIPLNLLERVCPQSFQAGLAPPVAAEIEGKSVDSSLLESGARWWADRCDLLIVEGVGGVMSPISDSQTILDLAETLGFPIILVVGNRLGSVSQALMCVEAIWRWQLKLVGVVLNNWPIARNDNERKIQESNLELLRQFLPTVRVVNQITELKSLVDISSTTLTR